MTYCKKIAAKPQLTAEQTLAIMGGYMAIMSRQLTPTELCLTLERRGFETRDLQMLDRIVKAIAPSFKKEGIGEVLTSYTQFLKLRDETKDKLMFDPMFAEHQAHLSDVISRALFIISRFIPEDKHAPPIQTIRVVRSNNSDVSISVSPPFMTIRIPVDQPMILLHEDYFFDQAIAKLREIQQASYGLFKMIVHGTPKNTTNQKKLIDDIELNMQVLAIPFIQLRFRTFLKEKLTEVKALLANLEVEPVDEAVKSILQKKKQLLSNFIQVHEPALAVSSDERDVQVLAGSLGPLRLGIEEYYSMIDDIRATNHLMLSQDINQFTHSRNQIDATENAMKLWDTITEIESVEINGAKSFTAELEPLVVRHADYLESKNLSLVDSEQHFLELHRELSRLIAKAERFDKQVEELLKFQINFGIDTQVKKMTKYMKELAASLDSVYRFAVAKLHPKHHQNDPVYQRLFALFEEVVKEKQALPLYQRLPAESVVASTPVVQNLSGEQLASKMGRRPGAAKAQ